MNESYDCKVIKSQCKTMSITIKDGQLIVRVPLRTTVNQIEKFLTENKKWIEQHFIKERELEEEENKEAPPLNHNEIQALADKALKVIPERVKYFAALMGVTYGRITVRNQQTRWGSCSAKGNLNFNCLLMLAPAEVLDSVIVHELCHRKYMNHSKEFYSEVLKVLPDYFISDKWLKDNGGKLIRRMKRGMR